MKTEVLIIDDHAMLRGGLKMLINSQPDMHVAGDAGDLDVGEKLAQTLKPHVIILDLTMPGSRGVSAVSRIRQAAPESRILVLTMHDDAGYLRAALALGAVGYVVKSAADTELISAIRAVQKGRVFVDAHAAKDGGHFEPAESSAGKTTPLESLSAREREVLVLVAEGHTNQAIADRIAVSVKTVESYRARLLQKLGMTTRAELVRLAVDSGLLKA